MTSLQLGLIVAGAALVAGVLVYNWLQIRRARRRTAAEYRSVGEAPRGSLGSGDRVEPSLAAATIVAANAPAGAASQEARDGEFEPPLEVHARIASDLEAQAPGTGSRMLAASAKAQTVREASQPDPDIECVVTLQPAKPASAGALAAGLHARLGRPLRWFVRRTDGGTWQLLKSDTTGEFSEIAACLLLANRVGAASKPMLDAFVKMVGEVAASLPAAFVAPDTAAETARAEALDRICADLDVQIGLTVLKTDATTITGTRLRGIAEATGFKLVEGGRFDWIQEDSGAVLFSLQNYRSEPFTADSLRLTSTPGAVFVLDVPRVSEPVRVYDQMKLAARRMAQTLDATLVDDNRRVLDDGALNAIREQVRTTAAALRDVHIEPGSPRALALFGS